MTKNNRAKLSFILCLALVLSLFAGMVPPTEAYAAEGGTNYNYTELTNGQTLNAGNTIVNDFGNFRTIVVHDHNYESSFQIGIGGSITLKNSYTASGQKDYSIESEVWKVIKKSNGNVELVKPDDAIFTNVISDELNVQTGTDKATVTLDKEEGYTYFYQQQMDCYESGVNYECSEIEERMISISRAEIANTLQKTQDMVDPEKNGFLKVTNSSIEVNSFVIGCILKMKEVEEPVAGKEEPYLIVGMDYFVTDKIARPISVEADNGTVTLKVNDSAVTNVRELDTVTVVADPDEGYTLDSIEVIANDGKAVAIESNTFRMPRSAVTVSAIFTEGEDGDGGQGSAPGIGGQIANLGESIITVEGNNFTINKPEADAEYLYYYQMMPVGSLTSMGSTPEEYVASEMAGVNKSIIDVTQYDFNNQDDVAIVSGFSTTGQALGIIGGFGDMTEELEGYIESDSVITVYKLHNANKQTYDYGDGNNLFAPGFHLKNGVVYGIYGVYSTVVSATGGEGSDQEPGDDGVEKLEAIDIAFSQGDTFDAIKDGEPLPELYGVNPFSVEFTFTGNKKVTSFERMRAYWFYAPKGSDAAPEEIGGNHVANINENDYFIQINITSEGYTPYLVEDTFGQGNEIHAVNENNVAYTIKGFSYLSFSDLQEQNAFGILIEPGPKPTPSRPSSKPSSKPTEVTVPVSNNENKVNVEAAVKGSEATIKPLDQEKINQIVGDDKAAGDVVIDVTGLNKDVDGVGIPTETLDAIVNAAEDAGNDTEHLVIKMSTATLTFDDKAMRAIAEQAEGDVVQFHFDDVHTSKLNSAQMEAVKDMDIRKGYEAYITVNGNRVSDFRGGTAEIVVPYAVPTGENIKAFSVWFIGDDGTLEKVKSSYDGVNKWFTVSHFSDYVIVYDEADTAGYNVCPKDDSCIIANFSDAQANAWYHDGVHYCLDHGIMTGYETGKFGPADQTTRAHVVQMLYNLEGKPSYTHADKFADVKEGAWYQDAVAWAVEQGIVVGIDATTFAPDKAITREQMAAILYRYAQYKGYDVSVGLETNILSYEDAMAVSEYAIPAMQWACGSGLVAGMEKDGTVCLDPKGDAVRSQTATMFFRLCETIVK